MTLHLLPRTETAAQTRLRADFDHWLLVFTTTQDAGTRRAAARRLREIARDFAWLADQIPNAVWEAIYCVRTAQGTVAP